MDNHAGGITTREPAFIKKYEEFPSIEALIKTFENMCDRSLDSNGTIRVLQSPPYVGRSINLFSRVKVYSYNSVRNNNKSLAFTANILRTTGHEVELCIRNFLRVWKADQLARVEQLIPCVPACLQCY